MKNRNFIKYILVRSFIVFNYRSATNLIPTRQRNHKHQSVNIHTTIFQPWILWRHLFNVPQLVQVLVQRQSLVVMVPVVLVRESRGVVANQFHPEAADHFQPAVLVLTLCTLNGLLDLLLL